MELNVDSPAHRREVSKSERCDQWTVEVKSHQGLWMVYFGEREEARCRDKNSAFEIGRDIATRTKSLFVVKGGDHIQELREN